MSRRKFTAEFKAKVVMQLLTGHDELGSIALEHNINPNQLRAWKSQFVEKAPTLFEDSRAARESAERERAL